MEHFLTPEIISLAFDLVWGLLGLAASWAAVKVGAYLGPLTRQAFEVATNEALSRLRTAAEDEARVRGFNPGDSVPDGEALFIAEAVANRNPDAMETIKATPAQLAEAVPGYVANMAIKAAMTRLAGS
ncbi:MAG: hypothetical protein AAGI03_01795 [Pseudomonadota bacterium]